MFFVYLVGGVGSLVAIRKSDLPFFWSELDFVVSEFKSNRKALVTCHEAKAPKTLPHKEKKLLEAAISFLGIPPLIAIRRFQSTH